MMYYTPQIWCSDNTDAVNRMDIQYGTSFCYPVSTMGAHVSAVPNHQAGRSTPLSTRGCVAMSGTFGYELDVTKLTQQERNTVKRQIAQFHKIYDLIQYGDYYRLTDTSAPYTVWEFAELGGKEALICAVSKRIESNAPPTRINVQGLDDGSLYDVSIKRADCKENSFCVYSKLSGMALKHGGISMPYPEYAYQAFIITVKNPALMRIYKKFSIPMAGNHSTSWFSVH